MKFADIQIFVLGYYLNHLQELNSESFVVQAKYDILESLFADAVYRDRHFKRLFKVQQVLLWVISKGQIVDSL